MISVYTRHFIDLKNKDTDEDTSCKHKGKPDYKKCKCPKWLYESKSRRRWSADTRSWDEATERARSYEREIASGAMSSTQSMLLEKAISLYLENMVTRQVTERHIESCTRWLMRRFLPWCLQRGLTRLSDIGMTEFDEFRSGWKLSLSTKARTQRNFAGFFKHCAQFGWLPRSPIEGLKNFKVPDSQTDYFTKEQYQALLDANSKIPWPSEGDRARTHAMLQLLRWSGAQNHGCGLLGA